MQLQSFYPVLCVDDVATSRDFYVEWFGFEVSFDAGWYVSLRRDAFELALLDPGHETLPEGFRGRVVTGVLLNVEVDDVDAEWQRLVVDGGVHAVLALRSEDFGQRHFIVEAPGSVLVDVITNIEPSPEFAESFS